MRILRSALSMLLALALSLAIVPEAAMVNTDDAVCSYPTAQDGVSAYRNGVCIVLALIETTIIGDGTISPEGDITSELGKDVTLTFTPSDGHCLAEVTVDGVSVGRPDTYTFEDIDDSHKLTARFIPIPDCTLGADCPSAALSGVPVEAWYHDEADIVIGKGMMRALDYGAFGAEAAFTREMLVEALYALGNTENTASTELGEAFTDVDADDACYAAVIWAINAGIVTGYPDGTFRPDNSVTREELAVMLYRCAQTLDLGFKGPWMFRLDYPDIEKISDWGYEALCWCTMKGVLSGYPDGSLGPQGTATRAEAAAMLTRFLSALDA